MCIVNLKADFILLYNLAFNLLQELDLHDILFIDAELGKTLQELNALVLRKHYIESIGGSYTDTIANLHFRGALIEDLCLDFTLPGYPEYILKPGDEIVCSYTLSQSIFFYSCFVKNSSNFLSNSG